MCCRVQAGSAGLYEWMQCHESERSLGGAAFFNEKSRPA
jgi:hypothetical protein